MSKFKVGDWWSIDEFEGTQTEAIESAVKCLAADGYAVECYLQDTSFYNIGRWSRVGVCPESGQIRVFERDDYGFQCGRKLSWRVFNKQTQYECLYVVIEELQCHVETLEEALEKVTKELIELREKGNAPVNTEETFKPISEMTMEDWYTARAEGWVFADNRFPEPNMIESIVGGEIYFDHFTYPFDIKGIHMEEPEEYQIIKRIE